MSKMHLFVKGKIGGTFALTVDSGATVYDLQCQVWSQSGVHPSQQQLVYQGTPLQPYELIADHKIPDRALIFLSYVPSIGREVMVCLGDGESEIVLTISTKSSVYDLKKMYWNQLKKKSQARGKRFDEIELDYNDKILANESPLQEYKIGYQKVTYIFVFWSSNNPPAKSLEYNQERKSHTSLPEIKALSLKTKSQYVIKIQAAGKQKEMLVVTGETTIRELKQQYTSRQKLKCTFSFVLNGKVLSDECMKVIQFAEAESKTYLDIRTAPADNELALVQAGFQKALNAEEFQKQVKLAKKGLPERSKIGATLLSTYHDMRELKDEQVSQDVKKATAFTRDLLKTKPSGGLNEEPLTVVHVMNNLFRQNNDEVLIYDSRKGMTLKDSSSSIDDLFLQDKPMVLHLKDVDGLGYSRACRNKSKSGTSDEELAEMQAAIDTNTPHPVLEDVATRLARSLDVEKERINVSVVFQGSVCFQYTVNDLTQRERETILQQDTTGRLAAEFNHFKELRVHPLFFRPAFDLSIFDKRGDKSFVREGSTFDVGPVGQKKTYTQPKGWVRYGLRVRTGNEAADAWLHPFQDPRNWWRAFHGTANAGRYMQGVNSGNADQMHNAAVAATSSIHRNGFDMAHVASYGPGVYCSPNPTWMEQQNYAAIVPVHVKGQDQPKNFRVMLQVGVRPGHDTLQPASTNNIWVVRNKDWIRAYGILVREEDQPTADGSPSSSKSCIIL